ncbi:MAG: hypothetical protein KY475_20290 [Planctomycetes bacterium]|nr:hypothetical protein [Planctomycetota bacterium]
MSIPALDDEGYLPPGVHVATMEELEALFGQFRSSDCRPPLFTKLREFIGEAKATNFVEEVIVDGSL